MKKTLFNASLILISGALTFTSCNQKDKTTPDDTSQQITAAGDQSNVNSETNNALIDADNAVSLSASNAKMAVYSGFDSTTICNATIDSQGNGKYDIIYHGKSADSLRKRSGKITIQVSPSPTDKWSNPNSTLIITYNDYTVTKVSTGKSIIINGADTITNNWGGNWYQFRNSSTTDSLKHTINGSLKITFDNGQTRSWQVTKQKILRKRSASSPADYTITVTGTGNANGYSNVIYTGTNRFGDSFTSVLSTPLVWEYNSNWTSNYISWVATSGVLEHHGPSGGLTVTFGIDNSGSSVTPGTEPYGYKLNWTGLDGKTKTAVLPY